MVTRRWLFALLLAVPFVSFVVSAAVQAHLNSELRSGLLKQYPDADPAKVAAATVGQLCETADATASLSELCDTDAALSYMRQAAVLAAVVALVLLFAIWLAGRLAQYNRSLLVYVFRPGLYLTVLVLVGLVVTHAGLAMATIYFGESAVTNRIHGGLILVIGLGAAVGVLAMIKSSFSIVKKAQVIAVGKSVSRSDAPDLWARVERSAAQLQALAPNHIVLGIEPNFYVTEADVTCLSGKLTGRTLYCSMSLCRILTDQEFDSIVGHELGHFKGADTKFSERFYPIYRGTALSLQALADIGSDGAKALPLLPAIATLSYFYESFSVAESRLSREREFAADAAGASITSTSTLAGALVKVHAFSSIWTGFDDAAAAALREGKAYTNASALFAAAVARNASPRSLDGLADTHLPHPTDSHPPLKARLLALKHDMPSLTTAALNVSPAVPALASVPQLEAIEEAVTDAYHILLARRLGIGAAEGSSPPSAPVNSRDDG